MSSVMISSRSFTPGAEIASAVASALGLELIGDSLYREAADRFGATAQQLRRALEQRPSLWGLSSSRRRRLASCVRATLSAHLAQDDAVYHGPFAALLWCGVAHLLKVRITSSSEARAQAAAGDTSFGAEATHLVAASDRDQNEIARDLFGFDDLDTDFDLVVDLSKVDSDLAVSAIVEHANSPAFSSTTYSRRLLRNHEAADHLAARLACDLGVDAEVRVHKGAVEIRAEAPARKREKIRAEAESFVAALGGTHAIDVQVVDSWLHPLPAHLR